MIKKGKIKIGISVGDLNGIGLEIILKTFEKKGMYEFCTPVLFASWKVISFQKKTLKLSTVVNSVDHPSKAVHGKLNLINVWDEGVNVEFGKSDTVVGGYALKSLEAATGALKNKDIDVLVTAPINKRNIQSERFNFPGHTEYLSETLQGGEALMLMVHEDLRVGVVTGHIPISKVSETISSELIESKIKIVNKTLKEDFGIQRPRIAVLGLNPHNGDEGVIGMEEEEIIKPTIKKVFDQKIMVFGPYAADGFFATDNYTKFDAIIGMYHDQVLTPFKNISFNQGVNYTAGLERIRTSPDHGTAYEIAGKGIADFKSFEEAIFRAIKIHDTRWQHNELIKNRMKVG